jgi:hypothetical protein
METHKYKIGQTVRLQVNFMGLAPTDRYEVVRLLPAPTDDRHNLQYRIKKHGTDVERIASESQLALLPKMGGGADLAASPLDSLQLTKKRRRLL